MRPVIPRADPAPSRLSYRFQRLMLTPFCRWFLRIGLPVLVVIGGSRAISPTRRGAARSSIRSPISAARSRRAPNSWWTGW